MKKAPKINPSKDPFFDELEYLAIEFPGTPTTETRSSSAINQFEKQLSEMSVRQVSFPRNDGFSDEFFF